MAEARRVLIIGGGVIGLACAERLAGAGEQVCLVEREARMGQGTSSRNSEVIHAGLYYPQGSLKAALCVEGRSRLLEFCAGHGVAHRLVGKLVVATNEAELAGLAHIEACARDAAVSPPLERWTPAQVQARAPAVRAVAALWSPGTGIIDAHGLMARLAARAEAAGALLLNGHTVVGVQPGRAGHEIELQLPGGGRERHRFDVVVNAAGHGATPICAVAGLIAPTILPLKGSYFRISGPAPADCLVYPVPPQPMTSLGVHLTIDLAGRARLGPDRGPAESAADLHVDPAKAMAFFAAARRFLPALKLSDLQPGYAGVRPKLGCNAFADFWIRARPDEGLPNWVDLFGIDSPGLTAALAIAARVADLVAAI